MTSCPLQDGISQVHTEKIFGIESDICKMARISRLTPEAASIERDEKLIKYLLKNKHTTPLEHCGATFFISCPIMVARQWHRHRTQSYSETSARMATLEEKFYIPHIDRFCTQSETNKQGSSENLVNNPDLCKELIKTAYYDAYSEYKGLLRLGVAKELARLVLPLGTYTHFYTTANLWNWLHFLELRLAKDSQWEIRQYAKVIKNELWKVFPTTIETYLGEGYCANT
jgi:thymidylate synthase (FAD)